MVLPVVLQDTWCFTVLISQHSFLFCSSFMNFTKAITQHCTVKPVLGDHLFSKTRYSWQKVLYFQCDWTGTKKLLSWATTFVWPIGGLSRQVSLYVQDLNSLLILSPFRLSTKFTYLALRPVCWDPDFPLCPRYKCVCLHLQTPHRTRSASRVNTARGKQVQV